MRVPKPVRRITDPVLERIPVPIVSGVNRGRWWNLASAGSGYVSGRRADAQMRLLQALMRAGDVVWDVGAHHGYVSLLAAAAVGPRGRVHAFEPSARSVRILERHLRWNRVVNARVHPVALGSYEGESRFGGGETSKVHALGRGEERVSVCTAESLVRAGTVATPNLVKIDVEGAEAEVLRGAVGVLPPQVCMLIAVHSSEADQECTRLLHTHGFEAVATRGLEHARRHPWRGDPELLCTGPAYDGKPIRQLLQELDYH